MVDPIEEEDVNLLFGSVQEVLKAAVMADADILSETFQLLVNSAKDFSRRLWGLVPVGLYLPAPPLYCPQPAILSEVSLVLNLLINLKLIKIINLIIIIKLRMQALKTNFQILAFLFINCIILGNVLNCLSYLTCKMEMMIVPVRALL